jgi:predicted TIM-barrel fold metal-dependent hydrolase
MIVNEKQKEALAAQEISIRVKRTGIIQVLPFKVLRRETSLGKVPYLVLDRFLDLSELMRVAEEYQLPVQSPVGKVFPRGKKETDFLGL